MIKVITLITKFIVVALIALLFSACNDLIHLNSIVGSGNVTTEKRTVSGDFKSVEVSNGIDLIIEQSDKIEITVEADDNLQKDITTTVENGVLVIACKFSSFRNITSKKVTVKLPVIEELEASSAATIQNNKVIKGDNISLNTSSAAAANVTVESDNINCHSSSGSTIAITGKALKLDTSASSGGVIDAKDLLANEISAQSSSGGSVSVHPLVSLDAKASSGGNISYNNVPKSIHKEANSGGSIRKN